MMTKDELGNIVKQHIVDSLGYMGDELSQDRETALDYYFGRPMGNEQEGLSQVVSRDVADTVEWVLPSLLRIFTSSDDYVRFDPVGPEDEEQADQETAVTNYVINSENPGFQIFHDWFKDALLTKTGVVTWWWDNSDCIKFERYTKLTDDEYSALLGQEDIELVEHEEELVPLDPAIYEQMAAQAEAAGLEPPAQEVTEHAVLIKRVQKQGKLRIDCIAPEEFLIHRDARDLDSALFVGHMAKLTIGQLKEMGISEEELESLSTDDKESQTAGSESIARDNYGESSSDKDDEGASDPTTKQVWVTFGTVKVDYDGDGYAERRRVIYCQGKVLENEYTDAVRYADICPIRTPHRFVGQSLADLVLDIQRIKSELWRQGLNNLYLANNPQKGVVTGQVEIEDLLRPRIGGIVRMTNPTAVVPIVTPDMSAGALQMLAYADEVREVRTGVSRQNQGLDQDTLNKTATGVSKLMAAAQQRVEMIARVFAETGVKRLMRGVHDDLVRNQRKEIGIKLKNKWVTINPASWRDRTNLSVSVGIGTGDKEQNVQAMGALAQFATMATQLGAPIAQPQNWYYMGKKMAEAMGRKDAEQFFTDPATIQPPGPQADPAQGLIAVEQVKQQATTQREMMKAQLEKEDEERQRLLESARLQQEREIAREKIASAERMKAMELEAQRVLAIELERIRASRPQPVPNG